MVTTPMGHHVLTTRRQENRAPVPTLPRQEVREMSQNKQEISEGAWVTSPGCYCFRAHPLPKAVQTPEGRHRLEAG